MSDKLECKHIVLGRDVNKRKKHVKKVYWNDELDRLYKTFRDVDKKWSKANGAAKQRLKVERTTARKMLDRTIQRAKRSHWRKTQDEILQLHTSDKREFWKCIGRTGIHTERKSSVPWEVIDDDGSCIKDPSVILEKWKNDFDKLLNEVPSELVDIDNECNEPMDSSVIRNNNIDTGIDTPISGEEIRYALLKAKDGKSYGFDALPVEVLRNRTAFGFLLRLFRKCYENGVTPELWNYGIITPIPKDGKDCRVPLNNRGICIASCVCKLYASVLNNRLARWTEINKKICDHQNGFRKDRSCQDQLHTLTSVIEVRKKLGKDTFAAFIDFSKAYDKINRQKLWQCLEDLGVPNRFVKTIQSLYNDVKCSVRVNGILTDWFKVNVGLKQGCTLSPLLFNIYVNSLIEKVENEEIGIDVGSNKVSMLLYADDIVLLSESQGKLQKGLDVLYEWCKSKHMTVNAEKSKVMHFRKGPSVIQCKGPFAYGQSELEIVSQYKYLGLVLTDFLDYNVTAKQVALAAHRALGVVIAKGKVLGGLPYHVYSKLFDSLVQPVIDYGASIWGYKYYNCIAAVQNRAMRFFLGVGKRTPVAAMEGDMGWNNPEYRQWLCVIRQWCRFLCMADDRMNKMVFRWAAGQSERRKTSLFAVKNFLRSLDLPELCDIDNKIAYCKVKRVVKNKLSLYYQKLWLDKLSRVNAINGNGLNKLRTYRKFKKTFQMEPYVLIVNRRQRQAFAKFRCGVAPIRIETGRFVGESVNERVCKICNSGEIEDEEHCLIRCKTYESIRNVLFAAAEDVISNFQELCDEEKFISLMSHPELCKVVSKACHDILKMRQNEIYV